MTRTERLTTLITIESDLRDVYCWGTMTLETFKRLLQSATRTQAELLLS